MEKHDQNLHEKVEHLNKNITAPCIIRLKEQT